MLHVPQIFYGYDAASNITSIGDNLAANRSQTFAYDNLNRLSSATGLYGTNTYAYDAVGNRTQKTVTVPFASTDTWEYGDGLSIHRRSVRVAQPAASPSATGRRRQ